MWRQLYTTEEAKLIVAMPFGLSTLGRIARLTGRDPDKLKPILERLCDKGLVVDLHQLPQGSGIPGVRV